MKNINLILVFVLISVSVLGQNLVINPGFESGMTAWARNMDNGASAQFLTENTDSPEGEKYFKCAVSKLGNNDWDLQIRSVPFASNEAHQHKLTFKAKSSKDGTVLKVYIQQSKWMGTTFTLTDSWETYTYEFLPNESTKQLKFNFTEVADYYLDDILLKDESQVSSDFNAPPSCVMTHPHVNAYFKQGTEISINTYAADIGGSGIPGEIEKVEFFVNDEKVGEATAGLENTYEQKWIPQHTGEYRLHCVATDTAGKSSVSAGVLITVGTGDVKSIGLSAGKGKYLGNVVRNSGVEPTFTNYWNAVTSGNGGKWKTVEATRDVMNWTRGDEAYNLAKDNHLAYRYHTLAWGSQYPDWIKTLAPVEFQEEMEEFIAAVAERYPYLDQIDVLNEALPGHQADTKYFINGLGGAGESGYDWAVWLFKKAREYFPNSKLVLNDFGLVNDQSSIYQQLQLLKVLRDSALVDGFGAQAHTFNLDYTSTSVLKSNLDLMATSGVPVYITEMDMKGVSVTETSQLQNYKNLFPVMWEHPHVAGISLWGYIYGDMWQPKAGLLNADYTERSAMVWLKNYMREQKDVGYPFKGNISSSINALSSTDGMLEVYPNPGSGHFTVRQANGKAMRHVTVRNALGQVVHQQTSGESPLVEINLETKLKGVLIVEISGEQGTHTVPIIVH